MLFKWHWKESTVKSVSTCILILTALISTLQADVIHTENFDHDGVMASGWTEQSIRSRGTPWTPLMETATDWSMQTRAGQDIHDECLISPVFNLTGWADTELHFWYDYTHSHSQSILYYSEDGGANWVTLASWAATAGGNEMIDISAWADDLATVRFQFVFETYAITNDAQWTLDDFSLQGTLVNDLIPPQFLDPLPPGQPDPDWASGRTVPVGCTVRDVAGAVDAATLALRVDWNLNGAYGDPGEEWQPLTGYTDAEYVYVNETIEFPTDGEFRCEFRASDVNGNGPAYSLTGEGIADDIRVRIDTTPPTASLLSVLAADQGSVTLGFTPADDLSFLCYQIFISEDSLVDGTDRLWTNPDDPNLNDQYADQTTVDALTFGTPYWFRMRARDRAGNSGDWSNTVYSSTVGTPLAPVADMSIALVTGGIQLTWSAPTVDENGNGPVVVEGFDVYSSTDMGFLPSPETYLASTTTASHTHLLEFSGETERFYRVVALGNGSTIPVPPGFALIPAGTFTMGFESTSHEVTLTREYYLGLHEVTNQEYVEAVQWAYDHGLVTVNSNTVVSGSVDLLVVNHYLSEIAFNAGVFSVAMSTYDAGSWGPGYAYPSGYDPADHPVKMVSWYGAALYCDWRSQIESLDPYYQNGGDWNQNAGHNPYTAPGYRLPTEAEWERVARYDDGRYYPWSDASPNCGLTNYVDWNYCVGWTAPVGSYPTGASELGLMDLAGNLFEWTGDWYGTAYYPQTDPFGAPGGSWRVGRGGDFTTTGGDLYTFERFQESPASGSYHYGFRVCRTAFP